MGDVVELRRGELARPVAAAQAFSRAASMRFLADWEVDEWGRDGTVSAAAARLSALRWDTTIGGLDLLPANRPAVVVSNSRRFRLTTWWVALTLGAALGRPVRFVGRSDVAPLGAVARRLGGLLARPDEVAGALRHGQLLVVGLAGTLDSRKVGTCDAHVLAPAVEQRVPVFPAGVAMSETSRTGRIEITPAVMSGARRRGPLAEVELARRVELAVGEVLHTFGGARTGTPLDWLPWPAGRD